MNGPLLSVILCAKGGVGKSTLAMAAALETGADVVTNDLFSPVDKALPPGRCTKLKPGEMPAPSGTAKSVIVDFGGYADRRMIDLLTVANVVVIPTINAFADLQVTVKTIRQVATATSRILVVVNRAKPGDVEQVRAIIRETAGDFPVLPLKTSKALARLYKSQRPISALAADSALNAHIYGELNQQLAAILAAMADIAAS